MEWTDTRTTADETGRPDPTAAPAPASALLWRVEDALGDGTSVWLPGDGLLRLTLPVFGGGPVPVTVDAVADTVRPARGIVYLLPGGGLDFTAAFLTPAGAGQGLAERLCDRGLLVVGVTPREDAAEAADTAAGWDPEAHHRDLAGVVAALDPVLRLPYAYAGHAEGAALALAATAADDSPRLRRLMEAHAPGEGPHAALLPDRAHDPAHTDHRAHAGLLGDAPAPTAARAVL
ncbi:hypothetical protein [Streptomyces sp. NPDC089799]|uniref:hypothetical protein n=1 Tax=Streptomyces sp. NPDC089799 TaxID=3155066 RepID=UPI003417EABB